MMAPRKGIRYTKLVTLERGDEFERERSISAAWDEFDAVLGGAVTRERARIDHLECGDHDLNDLLARLYLSVHVDDRPRVVEFKKYLDRMRGECKCEEDVIALMPSLNWHGVSGHYLAWKAGFPELSA